MCFLVGCKQLQVDMHQIALLELHQYYLKLGCEMLTVQGLIDYFDRNIWVHNRRGNTHFMKGLVILSWQHPHGPKIDKYTCIKVLNAARIQH